VEFVFSMDQSENYMMKGILDRLDHDGEGNYEIHDYKSGKRMLSQNAADKDGQLAKNGKLITQFYSELEKLSFYKKSNPKSLGIEWVYATIFPLLKKYNEHSVEDLVYTYTLHISKEIGKSFKINQRVLVTGGGAKNIYLISLIKKYCKAILIIPDSNIIDFKEALIFGYLGVLRLRNEVNCLASVTGVSRDHSSGVVFFP
jgi:anhydro-N-acetylmuramic acid kinase